MATAAFIQKRIEGKEKELDKLNKKLARIRKVESQNWEDPNPYFYSEHDLKLTLRDIEAVEKSIADYKAQLETEEEKSASRNVQVIIDFLDEWKKKNYAFFMEAINAYYDMKDELKKLAASINKAPYGSEEYKEAEEAYRELAKTLRENARGKFETVEKPYYNYRGQIVGKRKEEVKVEEGIWEYANAYFNYTRDEAEKRLKADLDKEADRKYDFIIDRTNAIVGQITDASNLKIGRTGELNGYVSGPKGKASIKTIGAGGYNIQIFHFRTLIHRVE